MKKRIRAPSSDVVTRTLDHLCQDVQMGIISPPNPEILTQALESLFPGERLIPFGSRFALHTARLVTWYVEDADSIEQKYEKAIWLKRRLSRYM